MSEVNKINVTHVFHLHVLTCWKLPEVKLQRTVSLPRVTNTFIPSLYKNTTPQHAAWLISVSKNTESLLETRETKKQNEQKLNLRPSGN